MASPLGAVFGPLGGRALRTHVVRAEGRRVGLVPLPRRVHWYRPGIPSRRLEMLGTGEATADEVLFPAMDGSHGLFRRLTSALRAAGLTVSEEVTGEAPHIPPPASWDAYLAALTASGRYLVRRSLRSFGTWAAGPAELHGERWGGDHGGAFLSEQFADFHGRVMPPLLEQEALELLWLEVAAEPVAVACNIVWNEKVYFYQSGRSIDMPRGLRPGIVLHARAIQRAIEQGRREYDFPDGAAAPQGGDAWRAGPGAAARRAPVGTTPSPVPDRADIRVFPTRAQRPAERA